MPTQSTRRLALFTVVTVLLLPLGWLIPVWRGASKWEISSENGPMESLQAVLLFIALVFYLLAAAGARASAGRLLAAGLALLALNFLLREFDPRQLPLPEMLAALFRPRVRNLWLVAAWVAALVLALRARGELWPLARGWLGSPAGRLFVASGFFYLLGKLFDAALFGLAIDDNQLIEELLEVDAAWLMLLSAVEIFRAARAPDLRPRL